MRWLFCRAVTATRFDVEFDAAWRVVDLARAFLYHGNSREAARQARAAAGMLVGLADKIEGASEEEEEP